MHDELSPLVLREIVSFVTYWNDQEICADSVRQFLQPRYDLAWWMETIDEGGALV